MSMKVQEIYDIINQIAPFELAEEWDNVGILAGSAHQEVERVLCALDLNPAVIEEAKQKDVQLIVTHHPILFRGRKNLREDDPEGRMLCELIRSRIALIAAHTNFDNANPGVNNVLAAMLGLENIEAYECGLRAGNPKQATLGAFCDHARAVLGGPIRCYGEYDREIHRVAVLGGAGGDFAALCKTANADVFLTGEISHHRAWDAYLSGVCALEAGHAATEMPAISMLADGLQKAADSVQCKLRVFVSEVDLFK